MLQKMTMKDLDLKGKRVFCRVDFNVPMTDGEVADDTRIRAAVLTIEYLTEQGAKVILASHLGRPKGEVNEEMRLAAVGAHLSKVLHKDVKSLEESIGETVKNEIGAMQEGDIVLLENV